MGSKNCFRYCLRIELLPSVHWLACRAQGVLPWLKEMHSSLCERSPPPSCAAFLEVYVGFQTWASSHSASFSISDDRITTAADSNETSFCDL